MDIIIECIIELILDGSIEIVSNRRVNKWIRYPILVTLILFFSLVIFGIFYLGILMYEEYKLLSLIIIILSLILLISGIVKFKNECQKEKQIRNNKEG